MIDNSLPTNTELQPQNNLRSAPVFAIPEKLSDPVTQLPGRQYALMRLEHEWQRFANQGEAFAIIRIDIDYFKELNESHGPEVATTVLQHVAYLMTRHLRKCDTLCRLEGEEFILLCLNPKFKTTALISERIRKVVEQHQPTHLHTTQPITVSVGSAISNLTLDKNGFKDTLIRADMALYEAKSNGTNTCTYFNDSNKRRYERFFHFAQIMIQILDPVISHKFLIERVNFSASGLLLKATHSIAPLLGDVIGINQHETENGRWKFAKVVRIVDGVGFAVEYI